MDETFILKVAPDTFFVRVKDKKGQDLKTKKTPCLFIKKSGYYRVHTGIDYSEGQLNESFFLTVRNARGPVDTEPPVCDTNAGPYKVIPDIPNVLKNIDIETDTTVNAGLFYFEAGSDTIQVNHYFLIQDEYPQFLNPPGVLMKADDIESVHFSKFELTYLAPQIEYHDLRLTKRASVDTAVIGERFSYSLTAHNLGPGKAREILVSDKVPGEMTIDKNSFNFEPDSTIKKTDFTEFFWKVDSLDANLAFTVLFDAQISEPDSSITKPFAVINTASVTSSCDTNFTNNFDTTTVVAIEPPPVTDISISQTVKTDSFVVQAPDTLWFVKAGESYSYFITVKNEADVLAENVIVENILPDSVHSVDFPEADTLQWMLTTLPPLSDTTLSLTVSLAARMPTGLNELINTVVVNADNEDPQKLDNNTSTGTVFNFVPTETRQSDLEVTQFVHTDSFAVMGTDTLHFADAGETIRYTIRIFNKSEIEAEHVIVTEIPPDSARIADFAGEDTLRWQLGNLQGLTDTLFTFSATVAKHMPVGRNELINTVLVQADNEDPQKLADNISVLTVLNVVDEPQILPDLSISQFVQTDSFTVQGADTVWFVTPGSSISYFIKIKNAENVGAQNVVVKDILPDSVSVGDFRGGDTIEWQLGNFSPFEMRTITFQAQLSHSSEAESILLVNTAMVEAGNEDPGKLHNNISVNTETFFLVRQQDYQEGCVFFALDRNVYRPENDAGLEISFQLSAPAHVALDVYDMSGYHIRKIVDGKFNSGLSQINWDGLTENRQQVGSGVYVITLRSENLICWKKVLIAR